MCACVRPPVTARCEPAPIPSTTLQRPVRPSPPTLHSCLGSCVLRSQKRTVVSPLPLASCEPSGEKLTDSTDSEWPEGGGEGYARVQGMNDFSSSGPPRTRFVQKRVLLPRHLGGPTVRAAHNAALAHTRTSVLVRPPRTSRARRQHRNPPGMDAVHRATGRTRKTACTAGAACMTWLNMHHHNQHSWGHSQSGPNLGICNPSSCASGGALPWPPPSPLVVLVPQTQQPWGA